MLHIIESMKSMEQLSKDLEAAVARHKFGVLGVHDLQETIDRKSVV